MWILLIIAVTFIGIFFLIKKFIEPTDGNNLNFNENKQLNRSKEELQKEIVKQEFIEKDLSTNLIDEGFKNSYRLVYDGAYDIESYPFEIVGEAHYQSNIRHFAVQRENKGCFTEVEARICREPNNHYDKNACRVDIDGLVVGYFAKNHAESWVRLLNKLNISDSSDVYVCAVIVGGGSDDYKFGVRLNIPSRVANSAKYLNQI